MDTDTIRKRLGELNTKAYYLLVALSFLFAKNVMLSLKFPFLPLAIGLTAFVAVVPLQDYFESERALSRIRWLKVVLLSAAFLSTLLWLLFSHAVPAAAAQKPSPPQPTEQQNSKDSPGDPESRLKAAEEKADRALMEKDYIERVQKETKDFYDKAFNSQMWTLGIMGVILTAVFGLTARFGLGIFDRRIQDSLRDASTQLETKFDRKLADELQKLKDSNAAEMKRLKEATEKTINELARDIRTRSNYQFRFSQGLTLGAAGRPDRARRQYRLALAAYKTGKLDNIISKTQQSQC